MAERLLYRSGEQIRGIKPSLVERFTDALETPEVKRIATVPVQFVSPEVVTSTQSQLFHDGNDLTKTFAAAESATIEASYARGIHIQNNPPEIRVLNPGVDDDKAPVTLEINIRDILVEHPDAYIAIMDANGEGYSIHKGIVREVKKNKAGAREERIVGRLDTFDDVSTNTILGRDYQFPILEHTQYTKELITVHAEQLLIVDPTERLTSAEFGALTRQQTSVLLNPGMLDPKRIEDATWAGSIAEENRRRAEFNKSHPNDPIKLIPPRYHTTVQTVVIGPDGRKSPGFDVTAPQPMLTVDMSPVVIKPTEIAIKEIREHPITYGLTIIPRIAELITQYRKSVSTTTEIDLLKELNNSLEGAAEYYRAGVYELFFRALALASERKLGGRKFPFSKEPQTAEEKMQRIQTAITSFKNGTELERVMEDMQLIFQSFITHKITQPESLPSLNREIQFALQSRGFRLDEKKKQKVNDLLSAITAPALYLEGMADRLVLDTDIQQELTEYTDVLKTHREQRHASFNEVIIDNQGELLNAVGHALAARTTYPTAQELIVFYDTNGELQKVRNHFFAYGINIDELGFSFRQRKEFDQVLFGMKEKTLALVTWDKTKDTIEQRKAHYELYKERRSYRPTILTNMPTAIVGDAERAKVILGMTNVIASNGRRNSFRSQMNLLEWIPPMPTAQAGYAA